MPKKDESVLCVPRKFVEDFMRRHGYEDYPAHIKTSFMDQGEWMDSSDMIWEGLILDADFVPRSACEHDDSLKQVIPYVVVSAAGRVFAYERGVGEDRLKSRMSIGIGGHVNRDDVGPDPTVAEALGMVLWQRTIQAAAWREFTEEIKLLTIPKSFAAVGVVNTDEDDVGKHHVGIVFECVLDFPDVSVRERGALTNGRFAPWAEIVARRDQFEAWSRLIAESAA